MLSSMKPDDGRCLYRENFVKKDGTLSRVKRQCSRQAEVTKTAASIDFTASTGEKSTRSLSYPYGLAVDGSGNLYVADEQNSRTVEVLSSGTVSVLNSSLPYPFDVAVDRSENLFIVGDGIVKLDQADASPLSSGSVLATTYIYGTGQGPEVAFNPGTASVLNTGSYSLNGAVGVAVDGAGNVYFSEYNPNAAPDRGRRLTRTPESLRASTLYASAPPLVGPGPGARSRRALPLPLQSRAGYLCRRELRGWLSICCRGRAGRGGNRRFCRAKGSRLL
jgi:hypothetical protein